MESEEADPQVICDKLRYSYTPLCAVKVEKEEKKLYSEF